MTTPNFSQSQQADALAVGRTPTNFPIISQRDPASNTPNQDTNYTIGQFWINQATKSLWYLNSKNTQITSTNPNGFLVAVWELISVSSVLVSLSDTSNTPVFPSLPTDIPPDNIQLVGGPGITVVSNPGSHLLTITNTGSASTETLTGNDAVAVSPSGGTIQTLGVTVANATYPQALYTNSGGGNVENFNIQVTTTIAAADVTKAGVAAFNSAQFTVDGGNAGFISLAGGVTPPTLTLTTEDSVVVGPTAGGTINVIGNGSITTVGTLNTVTAVLTGLTNHNVLIGAGTATITNVAPSATAGIPLISQGSTSDPAFGTAVVAGGGTGNTTFTAYSVITAGTTAQGPFQNVVGVGTSGQILTSNGAGMLPTWQNGAASSVTSVTGSNGVTASPTTGNVIVSGVDATTTTVGVASFPATYFTVTTGAVTPLPITVTGSGGITISGSPVSLGGTVTIANTNGNPVTSFALDAATTPVTPTSGGIVTVTGSQVATGVVGANVIRTHGNTANSISIDIQRSTTSLTPNSTLNGVSHFNQNQFTVDSTGFVSAISTASFPWTDEAVSFNASANNGYFITAASVIATLPASPTQTPSTVIQFASDTANAFTITASAGQRIRLGNVQSAVAGTATSTKQGDSLTLVFRAVDNTWIATASVGVWGLT